MLAGVGTLCAVHAQHLVARGICKAALLLVWLHPGPKAMTCCLESERLHPAAPPPALQRTCPGLGYACAKGC